MATTTQAKVDAWLVSAPGRAMNPDHAYGLQCVDVIDEYGQDIYGVAWPVSVGAVNGAKDLINRMPTAYWTRIRNNPNDPNLIPKKGDVVVYPGKAANLWLGHTGVVVSADKKGVTIIEQNGWTNKPAQRAYHSYASYVPLGWCRPNIVAPPKPKPTTPKPAPNTGRKAAKGTATVLVDKLNVRDTPSTKGKVVASYKKGEKFNYDSFQIANGYVWLSYVSRSGARRFVAEGENDGREDTVYVKGGV